MHKPIIASSVGELKDLVKNRQTGVLFEPGNEKSWQKRFINCYVTKKGPKKWRRMVENSWKRILR